MNKTTKKRLDKVQEAICSRPIPPEKVRECFEHFRATGELPEDEMLAVAVCGRVKNGYDTAYLANGEVDVALSIRRSMSVAVRQPDPIMDPLLDEAVYAKGMVQVAARHMLIVMAKAGIDVTSTPYVDAETDLPEYGSVGGHLAGFPERLVRRPYTRQARRLLARLNDLRPRLPHGDRAWFEQAEKSFECFRSEGDLPAAGLMLEAVLVVGELVALMRHDAGQDVGTEMVAYGEIARAKGEARVAALGRLQALVREGLIAAAGT